LSPTTNSMCQTVPIFSRTDSKDAQFDEAYELAMLAERLNSGKNNKTASKNKRKHSPKYHAQSSLEQRIEGFGSISPTSDTKKTLRARLSSSLESSRLSLSRRASRASLTRDSKGSRRRSRTSLTSKRTSSTSSGLSSPIVDELATIRKLRGEERVVAFFEKYDPARTTEAEARALLAFGGRSETEMWDALQARYAVNQRRRLLQALRLAPAGKGRFTSVEDVDAAIALAVEDGREMGSSEVEAVEAVIAEHTAAARAVVEKRQAREMTWCKGNKNSYQQIPTHELGD